LDNGEMVSHDWSKDGEDIARRSNMESGPLGQWWVGSKKVPVTNQGNQKCYTIYYKKDESDYKN